MIGAPVGYAIGATLSAQELEALFGALAATLDDITLFSAPENTGQSVCIIGDWTVASAESPATYGDQITARRRRFVIVGNSPAANTQITAALTALTSVTSTKTANAQITTARTAEETITA